jgi:hypothetical protein
MPPFEWKVSIFILSSKSFWWHHKKYYEGILIFLKIHYMIFGNFVNYSERLKVSKQLFQTHEIFNQFKNSRIEEIAAITKNWVNKSLHYTDLLNPRPYLFVHDFYILSS